MALFKRAPGSYSTVVSEAVEPIAVTCALPWRTPDAATICPRRGVTSARSGPARSDTSKLTRSFVNRLLRLTLLAPDIQQAIIDGGQPKAMQLAELTRAIPDGWEEQREIIN